MLQLFVGPLPVRTNFEYLHTLPVDPISNVESGPNVRGRPTLLNICADEFLAPLLLKFAQRHFGAI
jgi:hypothetical protein